VYREVQIEKEREVERGREKDWLPPTCRPARRPLARLSRAAGSLSLYIYIYIYICICIDRYIDIYRERKR